MTKWHDASFHLCRAQIILMILRVSDKLSAHPGRLEVCSERFYVTRLFK